jgi:ankyrin repeat protein
LTKGKNIDANFCDQQGRSPVDEAVQSGKPKILEILLTKGKNIDLNKKDQFGHTILINTIMLDKIEMLKTLLQYGENIDIYVKDSTGMDALQWAKNPMVKQLLKNYVKKKR